MDDPPKGGEQEGRKRLERFLAHDVSWYGENHDALYSSSTSRLSPCLHFGSVSAREVEHRLGSDGGPAAFRRQLCWRDFHHHVLLHFPRRRQLTFGTGTLTMDSTTASSGTVSFTVLPSDAAESALHEALRLRRALGVSASISFQSSLGGAPLTYRYSVTDRLHPKRRT